MQKLALAKFVSAWLMRVVIFLSVSLNFPENPENYS